MLKSVSLICTILTLGTTGLHRLPHGKHYPADATAISALPANPFIEKGPNGQYLNFDIVIKNTSTHTLELSNIEASVMDASNKPILKKSISTSGSTAGIKAIGNTVLKPGQTVDIFNPFYELAPDAKITFLQYEFFFDYADSPQQREHNKKRLPVDFDLSVKKIITPRAFTPKTAFILPLSGKLIVLDGHNFYPGKSSGPMGTAEQVEKIITSKANRYAFNFASADDNGNMYTGDPFKKENWYVFGKPVFAPAGGVVADVQNGIPDNSYNGKSVKAPIIAPDADRYGMGNYIVIDHGNGEFSMLQHLEQGSILPRIGQLVKTGQQIGKVGFSGNATYPHLHYAVMNGSNELTAPGIPSYFAYYKLYQGKSFIAVKQGRIDSGDIVESGR